MDQQDKQTDAESSAAAAAPMQVEVEDKDEPEIKETFSHKFTVTDVSNKGPEKTFDEILKEQMDADAEFKSFTEFHFGQLQSLGVPPYLWLKVYNKLKD